MLQNTRKLNTRLYIGYILVCSLFLSTQTFMFNTNTIKASAQEYNKVEVETIEIKQSYMLAEAPEVVVIENTLVPAEENISNDVPTVNPVEVASNIEDNIIETAAYIAENYVPESPLTEEELELLARVVHAESGNQDEEGKRLVADTVLNRMAYNNASVRAIVYAEGQFSTAPSLMNARNTPTEDELKIAYEESISQLNYEVYYFRTGYYHSYGTPAFKHGAHYFNTR